MDEATQIVNAWPLQFEAAGQQWAIRQPRCEERDDAQSVQRAYTALWQGRPEIQALADQRATADELATFDRAVEQAEQLLTQAEFAAHRDVLKRRIAALKRRKATWTRADEIVSERAALARDRWLTAQLLLTPGGAGDWQPACPDAAAWEDLPDEVREAARPAVWAALRLVEDARFFSATRSAPASS